MFVRPDRLQPIQLLGQKTGVNLVSYHSERTINGRKHIVSTNADLISVDFVQAAFSSDDMPWAKPLALDQMRLMLTMSTLLGLYRARAEGRQDDVLQPQDVEMIGMARFITDHVTFAYLTDVYVAPGHRGRGLGTWLTVSCRAFLDRIPVLRRCVLLTSDTVAMQTYEKHLGASVLDSDRQSLVEHGRMAVMATKKTLDADEED